MQRVLLEDTLKKTGIMMIDGSMSTALEELGCQLNDSLWTAKILAGEPEKIKTVHYNYFAAGADCGITASYQASIPGFCQRGYTEQEAENLIRRSVQLFCEARSQWWEQEGKAQDRAYPMCLGAVGPYGAYLADGSEYRGNYGVSRQTLLDFHQRRMELLWQEGSDLLLMETQPSLKEALLEAELAENMHADYWISFTCKDESHTCEGDEIQHCAKVLSTGHPHLKMIGINCTDPALIEGLIENLKSATDLPVAVYPNSGDVYDPQEKVWKKRPGGVNLTGMALRWMQQGISAVGGCCTTVCSHIRDITALRNDYVAGNVKAQKIPATER